MGLLRIDEAVAASRGGMRALPPVRGRGRGGLGSLGSGHHWAAAQATEGTSRAKVETALSTIASESDRARKCLTEARAIEAQVSSIARTVDDPVILSAIDVVSEGLRQAEDAAGRTAAIRNDMETRVADAKRQNTQWPYSQAASSVGAALTSSQAEVQMAAAQACRVIAEMKSAATRAQTTAKQIQQVQAERAAADAAARAQAEAASKAEADRIAREEQARRDAEELRYQREEAVRQQEQQYQQMLRESEMRRLEMEEARLAAERDARLQAEQRMFELQAQRQLWEQQREEQKEQRDQALQNMLLMAELMQSAPQMFQQGAPAGAFMPYGMPAGAYGAFMPYGMPAGAYGAPAQAPFAMAPAGAIGPQSVPTWQQTTPQAFNPGAEMFGLGAPTDAVVNPELQGAMIEPGWKILGPLADGRSYQMVAPDGRKWTIPSARVSFRDPATKQVVYMPPQAGPAATNTPQVEYVQGGAGSVASEIAKAVGALAPAVVDVFRMRENSRLMREQRKLAQQQGDGPDGMPAASMQPGSVPTWVYGVGAGLVGLGIVAALGKGKKRRSA